MNHIKQIFFPDNSRNDHSIAHVLKLLAIKTYMGGQCV